MLSQIERGEANPTVAVALAIATAFNISLDELVAPDQHSPLEVIHADDPHYVYRSDDACRIRTLSPLTSQRQLEFYEITLQPDGALRSAAHRHPRAPHGATWPRSCGGRTARLRSASGRFDRLPSRCSPRDREHRPQAGQCLPDRHGPLTEPPRGAWTCVRPLVSRRAFSSTGRTRARGRYRIRAPAACLRASPPWPARGTSPTAARGVPAGLRQLASGPLRRPA
jgi:transcriptional regulator with XRE-family HTH domain